MIDVDYINSLSRPERVAVFKKCCASSVWAEWMASGVPFRNDEEVKMRAETGFDQLTRADWLEAFDGHPKIGDMGSLKKKYSDTQTWSRSEQSSMESAAEDLLTSLAKANSDYEQKHGFIFIVCATGKSPREMLILLNERLPNDTETEVQNAAEEQKKITRLRLEKLSP